MSCRNRNMQKFAIHVTVQMKTVIGVINNTKKALLILLKTKLKSVLDTFKTFCKIKGLLKNSSKR